MRGFHVNWTRPFAVRAPGMPYAVEPFELLTTALSALFWRRENGSICIDALLDGADAAAIHREDIIPSIYPGKSAFSRSNGFDFDVFDWSVQPLNTALCSFSDDDFRRFYADTAIRFMRSAPQADDTLTYMVFAEQRLLAMCAEKAHIRIRALSDLPSLFGGAQNGYFSHVWGFKQQMRENPALYEDFCRRCAARLRRDFPAEAEKIARIPALSVFFDENKAQRR